MRPCGCRTTASRNHAFAFVESRATILRAIVSASA
jgi:hypothetical protein